MRLFKLLILYSGIFFFSACSSIGIVYEGGDVSGRGKVQLPHDRTYGRDSSYFERHGYERLNIPKGQYPPPGQCRIWYPGQPAGQQPPPGECHHLSGQVPPGAWLIHHPEDNRDHVHISVYDEQRANSIVIIGEFEINTGAFIREIR